MILFAYCSFISTLLCLTAKKEKRLEKFEVGHSFISICVCMIWNSWNHQCEVIEKGKVKVGAKDRRGESSRRGTGENANQRQANTDTRH